MQRYEAAECIVRDYHSIEPKMKTLRENEISNNTNISAIKNHLLFVSGVKV